MLCPAVLRLKLELCLIGDDLKCNAHGRQATVAGLLTGRRFIPAGHFSHSGLLPTEGETSGVNVGRLQDFHSANFINHDVGWADDAARRAKNHSVQAADLTDEASRPNT
jgi:hypothetical protein